MPKAIEIIPGCRCLWLAGSRQPPHRATHPSCRKHRGKASDDVFRGLGAEDVIRVLQHAALRLAAGLGW